jgi:lysophospholipase L1-like esterase
MPRTKKKHTLLINLLVTLATLAIIFASFELFFRIYLGNNLHYGYVGDLWVLKPNQKGFTYPNSKYATINAEGYRGDLIDPRKSTMLFLGDSFVFGYAIGDNDTLTKNLARQFRQRNISNLNMVNAGVPGYGVSQMIELYNYKYSGQKPKCVVIGFVEGDIFRQSGQEDPNYLRKMIVRKLIRSSSFVAFIKPRLEVFRQLIIGSEGYKQSNYDAFLSRDMQKLKDFNDELEKQNVTLVLHPWVYLENQNAFYDRVYNISRNSNLNILPNYFPEVVEKYSGKVNNLYAEDGHPSELYTERLAEAMAGDLTACLKQ